MSGTGAIKTSGRADLKMVDCRVVSDFHIADPGVVERLKGWAAIDFVDRERLGRRLRWRRSVWPWRRRAALAACRELIRIRERQLGLDRLRSGKVFW